MDPKLSVIIPVLNRRTLLPRTIHSVAEQSWRPLEIIVVDNGSTDGTYEEMCSLAAELNSAGRGLKVNVLQCLESGASKARNMGWKHSTGEIILFFDSDDIMVEGALKTYAETFLSHPKTDLVIANFDWLLPGNKRTPRKQRSGDLLLNHFHHCILSTMSFAATRRLLTKVENLHGELWPEHLGVWDDWALGFRILMVNPVTIKINRCVALVEPQPVSITGEAYCTTAAERYLAAIADITATVQIHRSAKPKLTRTQQDRWKNLILYRRVMLAGLLAHEARRLPEKILLSSPYASAEELDRESRRIFADALHEASSFKVRTALRFTFRYLAAGLRGCATIVTPFL